MGTAPVRISTDVHKQSRHLAALHGVAQGELLARAWREYVERHREEFASDLERSAEILRNGTTEDLVEFASRNAAARGEADAKRIRQ